MSGLMMLSVKALTRLLKASAMTRPTATTMTSPRIRKFLKPFNIVIPPKLSRKDLSLTQADARAARLLREPEKLLVRPQRFLLYFGKIIRPAEAQCDPGAGRAMRMAQGRLRRLMAGAVTPRIGTASG